MFGGQVLARDGVDALFHEQVEHGLGQGQGVGVEAQQHEIAGRVRFGPGGGQTPPQGLRVFFQFVLGEHMGTSRGWGDRFSVRRVNDSGPHHKP